MLATKTSVAALLAAWDSAESPSAPITSAQRDAIDAISAKETDEAGTAEDITGLLIGAKTTTASSRHSATGTGSAVADASLFPAVRSLEKPSARLDTGEKFLSWLHSMEDSLRSRDDEPYRVYMEQLERHRDDADQLLGKVNGSLQLLQQLSSQHEFVSAKSTSLHTACQHLLEEQTALSGLCEQLSRRLVFFTDADRIAQKLQSPAAIANSVNSDSFLQILERIDECYSHVIEHPNYKQSGAYRVKYQACLSRALGMVRAHVTSTLEAATSAATPAPGAAVTGSTADSAFALFYGKFRTQAPKLTNVISAIENRCGNGKSDASEARPGLADTIVQEYESALSDIQGSYLACRTQLLLPSVRSAVADLSVKYRRDHCGLVRAGCAFLLHVCEDEHALFNQFFVSTDNSSEALTSFLEGLCQVLYDTLRPLVIHLHHLETLSELTGILRSEMLGHHCATHPKHLSAFEAVVDQLLQDIQERLVYRAHIYIRTDISDYAPSPGDLAYPEKLEMMESIAESLQQQQHQQALSRQQSAGAGPASEAQACHRRQNSTSSMTSTASLEVAAINGGAIMTKNMNASNSPADLHGMWYPPVRRTLVCLSKLYRCLEREIFQGLSQEALTACMDSLTKAAAQIAAQKTAMDGQLFEIKHLLILREQIAPFHVELSVRETGLDFTKLRSAAVSLFTTKRPRDLIALNSTNALLEFLLEGSPEVREYCRDSRKEVDRRLKLVCEEFISGASHQVVNDLQRFQKQVDSRRSSDKAVNISREPWAKPELLQSYSAQAARQLKKQFPMVQRAMQLYLSNKETEFILFRPIRNSVMSSFIAFLQTVRADFTADEQIIIGCPSQEQIAVMITSLQLQPKTPRHSTSVSASPPKQMVSCDEKPDVEIKNSEPQKNPRSEGDAVNGNSAAENQGNTTLPSGKV